MAASRHKDTLGGKAFNPAFAATASARRKCGKWWGPLYHGLPPMATDRRHLRRENQIHHHL